MERVLEIVWRHFEVGQEVLVAGPMFFLVEIVSSVLKDVDANSLVS